jgi:hypothetical protein
MTLEIKDEAHKNTFHVTAPDEDGIFIYVKDGYGLTYEQALDKAKDMSQSTACEGTPYTIFDCSKGEKAIGIYLNGHLWRRETNPVSDYQIGWANYDHIEEDGDVHYGYGATEDEPLLLEEVGEDGELLNVGETHPPYYNPDADFYFFWFLQQGVYGVNNDIKAICGDDVEDILPKDLNLHDMVIDNYSLYIGYEKEALRVGKILASHLGITLEIREDNTDMILAVVEPESHEAKDAHEYMILAAYGMPAPTMAVLNKFEQVTIGVELAYQGLKHGFDRELLSDTAKRAYDTVEAAHKANLTRLIVTVAK